MMGNSAIIINVRVVPPNDTSCLAGFAEYLGLRKGAMTEGTEDDVRLRMNLTEMVDYFGTRPGSMQEDGSALFDRNGSLTVTETRKLFENIESSAITMTVSVRNEDVALFKLVHRQDWQRLARGNVDRYITSTGVIAPQDIEYVCAAHINSVSHHVHVVAWDSSGTWRGRMLPKARMFAANEELRQQTLRPVFERLSLERTLKRDELIASFRNSLSPEAEKLKSARSLLPQTGRTSYEHLNKEHPDQARSILALTKNIADEDRHLRELRDSYLNIVRDQGRLKGLRNNELDSYVERASFDLSQRCCNVLINSAKKLQPGRILTPAPDASQPQEQQTMSASPTQRFESFLPPLPSTAPVMRAALDSSTALCTGSALQNPHKPEQRKKKRKLEQTQKYEL